MILIQHSEFLIAFQPPNEDISRLIERMRQVHMRESQKTRWFRSFLTPSDIIFGICLINVLTTYAREVQRELEEASFGLLNKRLSSGDGRTTAAARRFYSIAC